MKEDIRIVAFCRSFKPARLKNIFEQTDHIRTIYTPDCASKAETVSFEDIWKDISNRRSLK